MGLSLNTDAFRNSSIGNHIAAGSCQCGKREGTGKKSRDREARRGQGRKAGTESEVHGTISGEEKNSLQESVQLGGFFLCSWEGEVGGKLL